MQLINDKFNKWIKDCLSDWEEKNQTLLGDNSCKMNKDFWFFSYMLRDTKNVSFETESLEEKILNAKKSICGWPLFFIDPKKKFVINKENSITYWFGNNEIFKENYNPDYSLSKHNSDYWSFSKDGMAFLLRGYLEDSKDDLNGGYGYSKYNKSNKIFSLTVSILRIAECLLHANTMSKMYSSDSMDIEFKFFWGDLKDRRLLLDDINNFIGHKSQLDSYELGFICKSSEILYFLQEILYKELKPLYKLFDFDLTKKLVIEQIDKIKTKIF